MFFIFFRKLSGEEEDRGVRGSVQDSEKQSGRIFKSQKMVYSFYKFRINPPSRSHYHQVSRLSCCLFRSSCYDA